MTDSREELATLAERVADGVDTESLDTERAVQLRAVEPLLELLDWDVRSPNVVPDAEIGDRTVEYLLTIDDTPVVGVRTAPPDGTLEETNVPTLEEAIGADHTSRGIATDARSVVLLLADGDEIHRRRFPFQAVSDRAEALGRFHRSVVEAEHRDRRVDHRAAARDLAAQRDDVVEAVTDEICSVTGAEVRALVTDESARAVDAVVERLRERADLEPDDRASTESSSDLDGGTTAGESAQTAKNRPVETGDDESAAGGEYVVRFFGGSSSVGAVGTGTPRATTIGVARYLLENQDLLAAVTLPWTVDDGPPVLAATSSAPEWAVLESPDGDSVAVRPIDDPNAATAVIEELAAAVGLRVMFQGDW